MCITKDVIDCDKVEPAFAVLARLTHADPLECSGFVMRAPDGQILLLVKGERKFVLGRCTSVRSCQRACLVPWFVPHPLSSVIPACTSCSLTHQNILLSFRTYDVDGGSACVTD